MTSMSNKIETFDPTNFKCKIHNKALQGIDINSLSKKKLYCWTCLQGLSAIQCESIKETLSYESITSMSQKAEKDIGLISQMIESILSQTLDKEIDFLIDELRSLKHRMRYLFRVMNDVNHVKEIEETLKDIIGQFQERNEISEGVLLDDYIANFNKLSKFMENFPKNVDVYTLRLDYMMENIKKITAVVEASQKQLKEFELPYVMQDMKWSAKEGEFSYSPKKAVDIALL